MSTNPIEEGTGSSGDMGRNAAIIHERTNSRQRLRISEEQDEQLFPAPQPDHLGPDYSEVAMASTCVHTASSNRAWQSVIQSLQVYDARVRSTLITEVSCSF
ncbi:unnamed protein product [Calypogeia fissa]